MIITSMGLAAFADETTVVDDADTTEAAEQLDDVDVTDEATESEEVFLEAADGVEPPFVEPVVPVVPENVQYTFSKKKVTITWDAQGEGVLYAVKYWSDSNSVETVFDSIAENSYSFSLPAYNDVYYLAVGAYTDLIETALWTTEPEVYDLPAYIKKPTDVKFTKVPPQGVAAETKNLRADNQVTLTWKAPVTGAVDHYAVYMGNSKGENLKVIKKKIKATETSYTFRAESGDHTFFVRAYWTHDPKVYATSSKSKAATLKGIKKYFNKVNGAAYWKVTFKKSATIYKSSTGTAKVKNVKKGTKAQAIGKYPKTIHGWDVPRRVQVKLSDGTVGWALWGSIKIALDLNVKTDYPVTVKEAYVKDFTSDTSYLVWVNEYTQRVNIFKGKKGNWKLIRSNRVTTGRFAQPISRGTKSKYKLGNKINGGGKVYRLNDKGRSYYFIKARGFHGSGYFHTRCWWTDSGRPRNGITTQPSTRGCIRMYTPDASYVLNMPRNSRVILK